MNAAEATLRIEVADLPQVKAKIEQARDITVALEQENGELLALTRTLVADLAEMVDVGAIELGDKWPAAQALVDHLAALDGRR